jgi:hypothetical protein
MRNHIAANVQIMPFTMSANGPKQTSLVALHMSAFGGKADMTTVRKSAFAVVVGG